jgi:two-component system cell cycle sensor histidine kinase/response regulator CckA
MFPNSDIEAILDISHDAILCVDQDWRITLFNRGASELFAYRSDEVLGKPLLCLVADQLPFFHELELESRGRRAQGKTARVRSELTLRRKNGETFPADVGLASLTVAGRSIVTVSVCEPSDHELLQKEALLAQRTDALSGMAASIVQDFKNLLAVIESNTFLLQLKAPPDLAEHIQAICHSVDRGVALTRRLLAFSLPRRSDDRTASLNDILVAAEPSFRQLLRKDTPFRLDLADSVGAANEDPHTIEQVIASLLASTRDALASGASVIIRTGLHRIDPSTGGEDEALPSGDYLCVELETGGLASDAAGERLFAPPFTITSHGDQVGLGLATARSIIRQGGGDIRLKPLTDGGPAFVVLLRRGST